MKNFLAILLTISVVILPGAGKPTYGPGEGRPVFSKLDEGGPNGFLSEGGPNGFVPPPCEPNCSR